MEDSGWTERRSNLEDILDERRARGCVEEPTLCTMKRLCQASQFSGGRHDHSIRLHC